MLVLQSCIGIQLSPRLESESTVMLTVKSGVEGNTKSQYAPDENRIRDLNLFVFDGQGVLVASRFEDSNPGSITLELKSAVDYSIRAVANYGEELFFADESELLGWSLDWPDFQIYGNMVMSGSASSTPVGSNVYVYLSLKRVASKVSFSVDDSALGAVSITSVKLCQIPVSTCPFSESNKASHVRDGDTASEADLALLDEGEEVVFYTLENMQGTLLPDNDDPWSKVPEKISAVSGLCTYVEVQGHFDGVTSIFSGDVTYRFYLGADNCSNFDVKRNTDYHITLVMSTDLDAVSWKISTDASVVEEGHGSGYIYAGRQSSLSSLYLGECFQYAVETDEALAAYFAGSPEGAQLLLCSSDGTVCSELELGPLYQQDGVWMSDVRCIGISDVPGEIWLYDTLRGRKVQKLNTGVTVSMPRVVISDSISPKPAAKPGMSLMINAMNNVTNVYLTDEQGNSLGGQWYDNTLVDLNSSLHSDLSAYNEIGSAISVGMTKQGKKSSFYAQMQLQLLYSGSPLTFGYKLCELCAGGTDHLKLELEGSGVSAELPIHLVHYPIKLNYNASTQELVLSNPSKLPLDLSYYDFTWFGPGSYSYDGITEESAQTYPYTYGGKSYKAYRLDCVNFENQSFGYTEVANSVAQDGTYSLSSKLFDYYNAFALFNRDNCSAADAYSSTFTVFDVALKGRTSTYPLDNSILSTTTGQTNTGSYGMHGGLVIFSKGDLICATSGVDAIVGCPSVARSGPAIIYSPEIIKTSLATPATFSCSQSDCTSGPNAGSTQYLSMALYGGCESVVEMTHSQLAALRTFPNGWGDNLFIKIAYYWKGYGEYSSSLSNPGNNTLSYVYNPTGSYTSLVSGCYGSDKFTSSNYSRNSGLIATYTATLGSNGNSVPVVPVLDFINERIYTMSETDSASELGHSSTYKHRYHPADCYINGTIRTTAPQALYKCVLPKLFQDQMKYLNTGYEGFYYWLFRDVSAPFFGTEMDHYSAGSNCDKYTTWYYKNANPDNQTLTAGTCILFSK